MSQTIVIIENITDNGNRRLHIIVMHRILETTCELAEWALTEIAKRKRIGESVSALCTGIDIEQRAPAFADAGARVLLLLDKPKIKHINIIQQPHDQLLAPTGSLPLEPFDIVFCQRALNQLSYMDAQVALKNLVSRLKIGGKLFISLYGIHSELGDDYPDGEKLVNERFAPLTTTMAQRYQLPGPVCLYSERNLFTLLMETRCAVIKTSTSALGHVRGLATRI